MKICGFEIGNDHPLFLIAGPCAVESEDLQMRTAEKLKDITDRLGINFIFKSSIDKANRTSIDSYRGLGQHEGLRILEKVRNEIGCPIITDVHEMTDLKPICDVVDVLQTPALLCRQTDFITRVALTGMPINIKKGQFLAPEDMKHVIAKAKVTGNENIMACERGVSFGYKTLVSDMRSVEIMKEYAPVIFDATHSVQEPSGQGNKSGGNREMVPVLAKAAIAVGCAGLFTEVHPDPDNALCDGPNSLRLDTIEDLLITLKRIDEAVKCQ